MPDLDRAAVTFRLIRGYLPEGRLLPDHAWRQRHRAIVVLLWFHAAALAIFAVAQGYDPLHSVIESSLVAVAALLASMPRLGRKVRTGAASWGLITSSALLVHFWGGAIEAHFHFFFVVGVLTLYQDWFPFLLALVYVVVHHGVLGAIAPASVYNHAAAVEQPWKWAGIHAVFVVATSIANLVTWRVNEQLLHEPLTGLPGRRVFEDRLAQSLARLDRHPSTVAVMFLDLDRFKTINDSLGHAIGDRLLIAVADRLRRALRRHDSVARLGGDEFGILCQDVDGESTMIALARRLTEVVRQPLMLDGRVIETTASLGIALATEPGASPAELMRDADVAMYRAKDRGGDRFEVFDAAMHACLIDRMELESALRLALGRGELRLVYQPEISLSTGAIIAVEALLRWDHPEKGPIQPLDFIPLAEETGLIVPIGAWVIEEACRQAERWRTQLPHRSPLKIRVNVSPRQLADSGLIDVLAGALASTGTDPSELDLEVTESSIMGDIEWTILSLTALKNLGVQLSVDDFGTGHSSLSHLKDFPVDTLKIDRSFISRLGETPVDSAIAASIVDLGHALGLSVTAEGVEHRAQLEDVRDLGCDAAQGYHLARPQDADAVTRLLAEEASRLSPGRHRQ